MVRGTLVCHLSDLGLGLGRGADRGLELDHGQVMLWKNIYFIREFYCSIKLI